MRIKSIILLFFALACGMVAAIGVSQVLNKEQEVKPGPKIETEDILVALKDIEGGQQLSPRNVRLEPWPKGKVTRLKGVIGDFGKIEGCRARVDIVEGEPILEQKMLGKGDRMTATDHIPNGYRVFGLRLTDFSGTTELLSPGDRVDVVAHFRKNPNYQIDEPKTQTVLQGVTVFSVGLDLKVDGNDDEEGEGEKARSISLLVTPTQVEVLSLVRELAKIQLVMRSPNDQEEVVTEGRTAAQILGIEKGQLALPAPAASSIERPECPSVPENISTGSSGLKQVWRMRLIGGSEIEDVQLRGVVDENGKAVWIQESVDLSETYPVSVEASDSSDSLELPDPAPASEETSPNDQASNADTK